MPARVTLILRCLLLTCAGMVCVWADSPATLPRPLITRDESFEIDVQGEHAEFAVDWTDDARQVLVVSSLGAASETYRVCLEYEKAASQAGASLRPVRRLPLSTSDTARFRPTIAVKQDGPIADNTTLAVATMSPGGALREFFLHVTDGALDDTRSYARVRARKVGEGERVRVYLDAQQAHTEIAPQLVAEIISLMDDEIGPATEASLGTHRDVDGDGKLAILLTAWLGKLQGGQTSVNGFVRSSDFRDDVKAPFGNRSDVMYLNSAVRPGEQLRALLAHEYTHAVCFSRRLPAESTPNGLPEEEDWLNEAIAHVAENLHDSGWSNLDYRVHQFLGETQRYPLVVRDYYRAGLWRDHGCRGATYLFLRWCVDHFGEDVLRDLMQNPVTGTKNLEWATGRRFSDMYRNWTVDLLLAGYSSINLQGRLGQYDLTGPHCETWSVAQPSREIELRGTTTAYFELANPSGTDIRRIRAQSETGSRLQLTLVRIPRSSHPANDRNLAITQPSARP